MTDGTTDRAPTADLAGWRRGPFTAAGITHDVFERGDGPAVILVPEIPGLTPQVAALGEFLVKQGFAVAIPSPFGEPGRPASVGYALRVVPRLCVASEFRAFAVDAERPFARYLRGLVSHLAPRSPSGVGVIGMCFTGGFALAAAVDGNVRAAVMSQPAVPFPVGGTRAADPGVSRKELAAVVERGAREDLCVLGLRFSADRGCRAERFATLRAALGDAFEVIELDSSPGNPGRFSSQAHSVLTVELRERPGHPAFEARERVVEFLRNRLAVIA